MILCVALNAALDVTYTVDGVRWHAANRINSVAERAGGKATNVARVLRALGDEVLLTGFAAGDMHGRIHWWSSDGRPTGGGARTGRPARSGRSAG